MRVGQQNEALGHILNSLRAFEAETARQMQTDLALAREALEQVRTALDINIGAARAIGSEAAEGGADPTLLAELAEHLVRLGAERGEIARRLATP